MADKQKMSLGESLVKEGVISPEQLKRAQEEERHTKQPMRRVLVRMGLVNEQDLVDFISDRLGIPGIELSNYIIDPKIIELVPEGLARKYEFVPVLKIGNRLTCAMVDPWNIFALDEVRMKTGLTIEPAVATETAVRNALDQCYGAKGGMEEVIKSIGAEELAPKEGRTEEIDLKELEGISHQPLIIKLVNMVLLEALKKRASDIHIEPEKDSVKTRFRIDGIMYEFSSPPKHLHSAIVSRIKIMSNLDIAERRMPQDGRFNIKIEGRDVDVRVSCVPTIHGESVVLRLLDVSSALLDLTQLGFSKKTLEDFQRLISRPHGIILVTGPTGCGKTTTLYTCLNKINTSELNIITIEDPVEYRFTGIRQIQVNPAVDLTFANGLRSILRHDPDVIMVGEIRDLDTAEIAVHSALTGHLVFSTLHTNDAPGAITRLIDMGVEPFLVSSSLIGVLAQRLVRRICPDCKEKYAPSAEVLKDIGLKGEERIAFYKGKGCPKCSNTGYRGRIGIFELMIPDDTIRNLVVAKAATRDIRGRAQTAGMITMLEDGILKVREGVTTVEEVLRVTREE
jgi:type IV pilus assembly protein PilB